MPLPVGINNDIVVNKVSKNDKNTLIINFAQQGEIDPLAALAASGQTNFDVPEQDIMIFPPNVNDFNGEVKDTTKLLASIAELVDPLKHIAETFLVQEKSKFDPFKGIEITKENMDTKLAQQPILDKVYENVVNQFITMMTPVVGPNSTKVRLLFVRSSVAKHFPKLRTKYLSSYPFIERMDIPSSASKVKFTKYEVEKGLDKGDKVNGAQIPPAADVAAAASLFGAN